jgi:hypothetical protein
MDHHEAVRKFEHLMLQEADHAREVATELETLEYPKSMSVNWLEVAQKMAEDAREQLAINRRR